MDQAWDKAHGPWPSTADILVRELSWQGPHNPCPKSKDPGSHGERLVEEYLSPARLRALARVDDLRLVGMLEMCVSTRESSLGNFGVHLPNLSQLKLNGSCLGSVRDLGTSLGRLRVLWLARCGLTDLDGIGCFPVLKELYVSYNNISDLSPLCLLEQLEVLDLEGNSVEVLEQVRYLQLCPRLATLTLEGNLVCLRPGPGPCNEPPRGGGAQLGHSSGLRGAPQARGHHWTLAVSLEGRSGGIGHGRGPARPRPATPSTLQVPPGYNYRAEIIPTEPPSGHSAPSSPCLRPSHGPPGHGPSPYWSLGVPCPEACFPRTQLHRTTPVTSPTVLAESSAETPPKACGSVDTSARPGHLRSSWPHRRTWLPVPPPQGLTLQTAVTSWPWLGSRPGGSCAFVGTWSPSRKVPQPPGAHGGRPKNKRTNLSPGLPLAPNVWSQSLLGPQAVT
ncbi:leucine-rich repeat-containing protein 56 isoform X11 [Leopardus geoffroyi]|uniref:leucine-rich repeat-containing protein 56 isoform X11 n=1 Tax=Leopardus geoffroyi TaxID=46844 RepID=UPI001E26610A|nr:leucine-rich repeat-containing protein 56 isoform X11 [Leopardus geoffroyi]